MVNISTYAKVDKTRDVLVSLARDYDYASVCVDVVYVHINMTIITGYAKYRICENFHWIENLPSPAMYTFGMQRNLVEYNIVLCAYYVCTVAEDGS